MSPDQTIKTLSEKTITHLSGYDIERLRNAAKNNLYFFAKGILGYNRLNERIHIPICQILQNPLNQRVRMILPRGWFKSTVMLSYAVWCATRDPNERILIAQNTEPNAMAKLSAIRSIFEKNQLFRSMFPELLPNSKSEWAASRLVVPRTGYFPEGTFEAVGIRTRITGRHYTRIFEDDTVVPDLDELGEENIAPTKDDIGQAIGWHKAATPLLTDQKKDQIVIIGTRWFEKDLLSWNRDNEPDYIGYERACKESDPDENGIGKPDEYGTITFPEEFDDQVLTRLRNAMGPYMFSCLYLNKPVRSGDMTFNPEWFQYYDELPSGKELWYSTTVDPGGDPEHTVGEADWTVVLTTAMSIYDSTIYVVGYDRIKSHLGDLMDLIFKHIRLYKPFKVGIEAIQFQKALMWPCKTRMKAEGLYTIFEAITHGKRSKEARVRGLQPVVYNGTLKFRHDQRALIQEMLNFPYGAHDDLVDALALQQSIWQQFRTRAPAKEQKVYDPFTLEGILERSKQKRSSYDSSHPVNDLIGKNKPLLIPGHGSFTRPSIFNAQKFL